MSIIYSNPIRVICKKNNSTKLIKGATYEVSALYNTSYGHKIARVIDVGNYNADYFVLENNQLLSSFPDFETSRNTVLDVNNVNYSGQFVRCRYSSSQSLKENEIYYVEEHKKIEKYYYNGSKYYEDKFKIRGIKNLINCYCFNEIPIIEQRNLKLKNLSGENIKTGEQTRKFLLYSEKEKNIILLDIFTKTLTDVCKTTNLNFKKDIFINEIIPNIMIKKGRKYALTIEDIKPFLGYNIKNLMSLICE